jgi:hypothetical protein
MMKLLAILALAFGANATSDCLTTCGGCYSMVTHVISCVTDPVTECPYDPTSYYGSYSTYYFYSSAETCPDGMAYCSRTQDTSYSATCLAGDLASSNCCPFVYEDIAGYQPVSLVMGNPDSKGAHAQIDEDLYKMKEWLQGTSDDPVELKHMTYNFTKAHHHYINGGDSCKTWEESSSGWPYGTCTTYRTLKGFSKDLTGEPMYDIYNNYWGSTTYADDFVSAAIMGTADAGSGVDFGTLTDIERYQLIMKGVAYQSTWIYALHEYESAIVKCEANSLDDETGAPHAWDEGWAFYAGSMQTAGESDGMLTYTLAEKRCSNFGTCDSAGLAEANKMHLDYATSGLAHIRAGECTDANDDLTEIKKWMTVPLIQGTLRYAYKCDPNAGNEGAEACSEGYAFAAALLPQLDNANPSAAATVKTNMIPGASIPDGFAAVKSAIESTYISMGISCLDIAGLCDATTDTGACTVYKTGMEPCDDATLASGAATHGPAIAKAAAVFAMVMLYLA